MSNQLERLRILAGNLKADVENKINGFERKTKIITVASGKGGVGKTNFTLNLGIALGEFGKKVLILDADLGLANIDVLLGAAPKYNLSHVISGKRGIKDIIIKGPNDIDIIPGGSGVFELAQLHEEELNKFLSQLSQLDNEYDFLLIDTGAGLNKSVLSFSLAADEVFIITIPEPTSLTDAYGLIKTINKHRYVGKIKLIVNRVTSKEEGELTGKKIKIVVERFLDNCDLQVLGFINDDRMVIESVKKQEPFLTSYPNSMAASDVYSIAATILDINYEKKINKGLKDYFSRISSLLRGGN